MNRVQFALLILIGAGLPHARASAAGGTIAAANRASALAAAMVDLATGRMAEIAVDHFGDYHFLPQAPDGRVIAGVYDLRSTLWRFQPDVR